MLFAWIGLRENPNRKPEIFLLSMGFSCNFSLHWLFASKWCIFRSAMWATSNDPCHRLWLVEKRGSQVMGQSTIPNKPVLWMVKIPYSKQHHQTSINSSFGHCSCRPPRFFLIWYQCFFNEFFICACSKAKHHKYTIFFYTRSTPYFS